MATIKFDSDKRFVLGSFILKAAVSFNITYNDKLIPYDFPFAKGIHYEDLGEGEVNIMIEGLLLEFENIGNAIVDDINDLLNELKIQSAGNTTVKFVHPDLKAENVKIKSINISQEADQEGYKFKVEMLRHTSQVAIDNTQASVEKDFAAQVIETDNEYTIVDGDTLWGVAQRFLGNGLLWRELYNYKTNKTALRSGNPNLIFPGEKILIPNSIS